MQILNLQPKTLDLKDYKKRNARADDFSTLITESTLVLQDGAPRMAYIVMDDDCREIIRYLQTVDFEIIRGKRTGGMFGSSRVVGWMPRRTLRTDFCHIAKLAEENPAAHYVICSYADKAARWYENLNPELYAQHAAVTDEKIGAEFRINQNVFTSGIVNKNNALPYHHDAGNFKDVWSCMLVFKKDVGGGYLSVPEFDLGFECRNNSLFMFDGQGVLHGVTPIARKNRDAFRYSIVYYSLQQIWNCLPINEEIARIRKKKTEREINRAEDLKRRAANKID